MDPFIVGSVIVLIGVVAFIIYRGKIDRSPENPPEGPGDVPGAGGGRGGRGK
jgi:hypothetical protein